MPLDSMNDVMRFESCRTHQLSPEVLKMLAIKSLAEITTQKYTGKAKRLQAT